MPPVRHELAFFHITASHEERKTMVDVVRRTADQVFIPLMVCGGIRTLEDIREMLMAAKYNTVVNTAAAPQPEIIESRR